LTASVLASSFKASPLADFPRDCVKPMRAPVEFQRARMRANERRHVDEGRLVLR